jgi:hypothetical protein
VYTRRKTDKNEAFQVKSPHCYRTLKNIKK